MDVTSITDPDQMRAYRDGYAQGQIDGARAEAERLVTRLLSDDAVAAFGAAWLLADTQGEGVEGSRRKAGLKAVAARIARGES